MTTPGPCWAILPGATVLEQSGPSRRTYSCAAGTPKINSSRQLHTVSGSSSAWVAGYDTFAYRQPPWAQVLQIFEVDQAATQLAKRERLTAAGVPVPDNVTYVAADFRRETLAQALVRSGFDMSMQTFISCLGVLVYLEAAAVDAIFHFAAALASGSEIVVTFRRQRDADDSSELSAAVAARGEPWISAFDPEALRAALLTMGFASVTLVFGSELDVRYTLRRTDGLHPPQRMMMLSARR